MPGMQPCRSALLRWRAERSENMVTINGYDIALTRGDTLFLRIELSGRALPDGTDAVFTVKKDVRSTEPILQKRFGASDGSVSILLSPRETNLPPGVYFWDVRLQIPHPAGGYEVLTPMAYAAFAVLETVGDPIGTEDDPGVNPDLPMVQELVAQIRLAIEQAGEAAARAEKAANAQAPRIGENRNWWLWDSEAGVYVDSGVRAEGTAEPPEHVDAEKLGGKAPDYYLTLHNWVDNSDFSIAQAGYGGMHGSMPYAADRWACGTAALTVSKTADGIALQAGGAAADVYQKCSADLAAYLAGRQITLAVMDGGGNLHVASGTVNETEYCVACRTEDWTIGVSLTPASRQLVRMNIAADHTAVIRWIALYEGVCTAETLPPYQPKEPAAELAVCQRYFVRIGGTDSYYHVGLAHAQSDTQLVCSVSVPQAMREGVSPSAVRGGQGRMTAKSGTVFRDISAVSLNQRGVSVHALTLTTSGAAQGTPYDVYVPTGSWLDLSADL